MKGLGKKTENAAFQKEAGQETRKGLSPRLSWIVVDLAVVVQLGAQQGAQAGQTGVVS